jgi:UbiD family decarboxylase
MMGMAILGTWAGYPIKNLIVVDEDIDPFDWNQVEWALATRFQPARDLEVIDNIIGHDLDPSADEVARQTHTALTSKVIIDATRFDAAHYERECVPDAATMQRIREQWDSYGIPLRR